ncbi:AraC family transcriptional regulator [Paraburkholderia solisilvae]|uniref:RCS-specific HTH-type transcriptional activator RclR n=1 Tax=Paraburkholderia solisilvae TaxID=624376 RepID=A0A6J5EZG4_9BURK|nr:AraC family transcriptional regulator [Paraburkholderia solisilvae]CAB3771494.1 RCS-specific HTH-type transcriptional activator RclR [Paraburkholderia solisilvae]
MIDRLETLFERFSVSARVFHTGALCGITDVAAEDTGQLHLLRNGEVAVVHDGQTALRLREPSVLLYPRPMAHRFVSDPERGADFACAQLRFECGVSHPIAAALPAFICMPLNQVEGAEGVLALIFDEAFSQRCGRKALLDRLFEVVLIQILRCLMEHGEVKVGLLAGLSHQRLRHALVAMHEDPAQAWTLEGLAARAGMSRSVFATTFHEAIGVTPGQYLQSWRISLVQSAIRRGQPLKLISDEVGYGSEAALSRAFKAQTGMSPRDWKNRKSAM